MQFIPYLSFDGNCREAFEFYAEVLGGEIKAMLTHRETPIGAEVPETWQDRIINAHLVAEGAELMGGDSPPEGDPVTPSGFCVSIQTGDAARGERIFNAFAAGGTVLMPYEQSFWAKKFGMVTDRYGTPWMINVAADA